MRRAPFALVLLALGCGAEVLDTHRYALSPPLSEPTLVRVADTEGAVLTVEELEVDAAYDDERMAYRPSPYRLEYYPDHLWSSTPSLAISDYLRGVYARSGRFRRVTSSHEAAADVVLRGRVSAIEEVDVTARRWVGRVALDLELEDARSGEVVWSQSYVEQEPLARRDPAALAPAVGAALARIAERSLPEIVAHALAARRPRPLPCPAGVTRAW